MFISRPAILVLLCLSVAGAMGQPKKNARDTTPSPTVTPTPGSPSDSNGKKNGRPIAVPPNTPSKPAFTPTYFYEFSRPGFVYSEVKIAHDENGKGMISFKKDGAEEGYTDPIELSRATIERIDQAYSALNFLDSSEEYQTKMDHSNMGNVTLLRKKGGKERKTTFNWSENKDAMDLMNVYRSISNEYTWRFEMLLARDTQPLLTPGLMDAIDQYMMQKEIADPEHLLPMLTELSNDERLPLMARNHASRLIKRITKK